MSDRPVIILHGYSDKPENADGWCKILSDAGYTAKNIHVGGYVSLSNEVTIKDVAEAFDRALRARIDPQQEFDAIVHSTGMLVIRAWLTSYGLTGDVGEQRRGRLKHLIGLAPATFGSPMAHKGRSWVGALLKGTREVGPDFLEAGDQVLSALELGSKYTWDLAGQDLLKNVYGPDGNTPYPFVLIGTEGYGGVRKVVNQEGTDGTVRWAGCGFNTRKLVVDLSMDPALPDKAEAERADVAEWFNAIVPLAFIDGHDHGTIFSKPDNGGAGRLVDAVLAALKVDNSVKYEEWAKEYANWNDERPPRPADELFQQFLTHVVDERGDSVTDYYLELCEEVDGKLEPIEEFEEHVHTWKEDPSYRCFHVRLGALQGRQNLYLHLSARSGTALVEYYGHGSQRMNKKGDMTNKEGIWDARIRIPSELQTKGTQKKLSLFYPFTTTLLQIRLNREPSFGEKGRVFWWH